MSDKNPESHVNRTAREISDLVKLFRENWKRGVSVILVGAVCVAIAKPDLFKSTFSWLRNELTVSAPSKEQPVAVDSPTANGSAGNTSPSGALAIQNGELLVMKSSMGMAVLEMSFKDRCEASYRWRFKPAKGGRELTGSANLFEQYGSAQNSSQVTDLAGRLVVVAGPLKTSWSCNSNDSGWIYPQDGLEIYTVKKISFSKFRL
ncbi:hypothetical protein [Pseudomonas sp. 39167]|uniref:hypothetical protein n=1 Tax=Pseudomonas sp. 39167 TaxID=2967215 RepID=UPI0023639122|nr:hypothetical protein [Pseudomonas sp. 39167]MDD2032068.1 hypothetical protein [Pseudomonas sp. 39167]